MWRVQEEGVNSSKVTLHVDNNIYDITGLSNNHFAMVRSNGGSWEVPSYDQWKAMTYFGNTPDAHSLISSSIATYWQDVVNHNYHITSALSPLVNAGIYLTSPATVLYDRDGISRSNPPEIGPYEYAGGPLPDTTPPAAPTGVTIH
jgi:hypothetical protein